MSSISFSSLGSPYSSRQNNAANRKNDFQALASALNSGDLSGAQNAFAALQKDLPPGQQAGATGGQNDNSKNNPVATDFQNLSQALSSGDLSSAQSAFAKLQQDMQAMQGGHRGHHHHHGGGAIAPQPQPQPDNTSTGASSSSGDAAINVQI